MYRDISILICRVLSLYLFVAVLSLMPSVVGMFAAPVSGVEAVMMQPVKIAIAIALIGQFVLAVLLWIKTDFWAGLITRPVKGTPPEKLENVSEICAAVLMAAGFLVLAHAIKDVQTWLPGLLLGDQGSRMAGWNAAMHNMGMWATIIQAAIALLLIFTPRGIWNGVAKIRKV